MKPKVLYQEARGANQIAIFINKDSCKRLTDDYLYYLEVSVTRYAPDVVVLEIRIANPDADIDKVVRDLLPAYIYSFAAIREGIKAFDTALGQFEVDDTAADNFEPD